MRAYPPSSRLRPKLRPSIIIIFFVLATAPRCSAVCPYPRPKPNAEFFHSEVVLTGTVLSQRDVNRGTVNGEEGVREIYYRIRVLRLFRGHAGSVLQVYSSVDSVGLYLDTGKKYLLFAFRSFGHKTLRIDSCGSSGSIDKVADAILQLEKIPNAGDYGDIEGELRGYDPNTGDPNLRIIVRSNEREFVTKVDNHGQFHLRVPPGEYSLHAQSEKFKAEPFMFSYDHPERFLVHRGSLTQMVLDLFLRKH